MVNQQKVWASAYKATWTFISMVLILAVASFVIASYTVKTYGKMTFLGLLETNWPIIGLLAFSWLMVIMSWATTSLTKKIRELEKRVPVDLLETLKKCRFASVIAGLIFGTLAAVFAVVQFNAPAYHISILPSFTTAGGVIALCLAAFAVNTAHLIKTRHLINN